VDTQTDDRRLSDEVVAAQVAAAAIDQGIKILDAEGGFKAQATLDVAVKAPSAEAGPLPDEMLIEQKTPQALDAVVMAAIAAKEKELAQLSHGEWWLGPAECISQSVKVLFKGVCLPLH